MSSDAASVPLVESTFSVDVTFRDAISNDPPAVHSIECLVDTGYTGGIALPESYNEKLMRHQGEELVETPLGTERADTYAVHVVELDETDISPFPITATCSMKNKRHGLLGMEFLRYVDSTIYDDPENKLMNMFFAYVDVEE